METEQDERELTELQSKRNNSSDGDKKREKTLTNPLIGQMDGHKTMCKKCSIKEPTMTVNCAAGKCEPNEGFFIPPELTYEEPEKENPPCIHKKTNTEN